MKRLAAALAVLALATTALPADATPTAACTPVAKLKSRVEIYLWSKEFVAR